MKKLHNSAPNPPEECPPLHSCSCLQSLEVERLSRHSEMPPSQWKGVWRQSRGSCALYVVSDLSKPPKRQWHGWLRPTIHPPVSFGSQSSQIWIDMIGNTNKEGKGPGISVTEVGIRSQRTTTVRSCRRSDRWLAHDTRFFGWRSFAFLRQSMASCWSDWIQCCDRRDLFALSCRYKRTKDGKEKWKHRMPSAIQDSKIDSGD